MKLSLDNLKLYIILFKMMWKTLLDMNYLQNTRRGWGWGQDKPTWSACPHPWYPWYKTERYLYSNVYNWYRFIFRQFETTGIIMKKMWLRANSREISPTPPLTRYDLRPCHTLPDSANGRVTNSKIFCPFVSVRMRFLPVPHAVNAFRVRWCPFCPALSVGKFWTCSKLRTDATG